MTNCYILNYANRSQTERKLTYGMFLLGSTQLCVLKVCIEDLPKVLSIDKLIVANKEASSVVQIVHLDSSTHSQVKTPHLNALSQLYTVCIIYNISSSEVFFMP